MAETSNNPLLLADAVCFDVDSTVIKVEAIDEFAGYLGLGEEVAKLTRVAMQGGMLFQDALDVRLKLMNPKKEQLESFCSGHELPLTPYVHEFIQKLLQLNKHV
jgi:phosphoserine phosphatase